MNRERRTYNYLLLVVVLLSLCEIAGASCPTNHAIRHDGAGRVINVADEGCVLCPSCFSRYWCLTTGYLGNNNGSSTSWWQRYSEGKWFYDGSWSDEGIMGCCGMWDSSSSGSRTMMAVVEQSRNEGSTNHAGEYEVEVGERPIEGNDFTFTRETDYEMAEIPRFRVGSVMSPYPPTYIVISLSGWMTGYGPAHYWIKLQNGQTGTNLTVNPICSPGGTQVCPPPIIGYQIRAIAVGSNARPTTSLASDWNLPVGSQGSIFGCNPSFPVPGITITTPSTCTDSNNRIYIATQLRYADGYVSKYVSGNSYPICWCNLGCTMTPTPYNGSPPITLKCQKSGSTAITCSVNNGFGCATDTTMYYGPLAEVSNYHYAGSACYLGNSFTKTFDPGEGDWFWILVGTNELCESSYGKDSAGSERPHAIGVGECNFTDPCQSAGCVDF